MPDAPKLPPVKIEGSPACVVGWADFEQHMLLEDPAFKMVFELCAGCGLGELDRLRLVAWVYAQALQELKARHLARQHESSAANF